MFAKCTHKAQPFPKLLFMSVYNIRGLTFYCYFLLNISNSHFRCLNFILVYRVMKISDFTLNFAYEKTIFIYIIYNIIHLNSIQNVFIVDN